MTQPTQADAFDDMLAWLKENATDNPGSIDQWAYETIVDLKSVQTDRISKLEAVASAARAWEKHGRWPDYQMLHLALEALEAVGSDGGAA